MMPCKQPVPVVLADGRDSSVLEQLKVPTVMSAMAAISEKRMRDPPLEKEINTGISVSYTHLTLPTSDLV